MQPHDLAPAEDPWASALVLHPHPDMGGDRFNNVVSAVFDALPSCGITALRFDFSSSDLDASARETVAMLDLLDDGRPRFIVGYSFGGGIAATVDDERVAGWFLIAPALSMVDATIGLDPRPKAVVAAEHDRFFSPSRLDAATSTWMSTELSTISGADHMFVGRTDAVAESCRSWLVAFR